MVFHEDDSIKHTVHGRNPAPAWMVETLYIVVKANYQLVQNDWEYD